MGRFVKGDIVVLPFPFSDLSAIKRRPALVITQLKGDDVILCQITSIAKYDGYSIKLKDKDFLLGGLNKKSYIRPNHIFTVDTNIIVRQAGKLCPTKLNEVIDKIVQLIKS